MLTLRSLAAHLSLIPASGNMIMHRLSIPGVIHQPGVTSLFGSKGPLPGPAVTLSRQLHRQTPDVEVDLLQLDGEDSGIAEVLMCRQKARNALGNVFVSQMREIVACVSRDAAVRVLLFRSLLPGVFCAGADLKERAQMNYTQSDLFVHSLRTLMMEIAYSAQMGLIETTRGLLPGAGGSQRLPRAVGVAVAKEMIFTGMRVGGQRAEELGLVNRAVPQNPAGDAAYREAVSLAREILPQAPIAVRMAKEAMNRGIEVDSTSGMAIERMCYAQVIPTRDRQEGMAAFMEKRPPHYTGE
ncbi:enoyl-CoA hydratase domain-containing protein 2, mitochondrial isoform X2 [Hypomesus transpacificus]|uniref:enoyl-CoA hydratase domain-containing protein 2, mitochondrial isoform X2 n=1 Tax=Hypomesus transpacificus TaxID=137520 RepID=UPI001F0873F6|nr:enoyl-CoA hydratase domain-containing protein 2, mitochondrial isoform X2 [Hypomesus transpacificus]